MVFTTETPIWGVKCDFQAIYRFTLYLVNDKAGAIVTMKRQQNIICNLTHGAISNDLEWTPLT